MPLTRSMVPSKEEPSVDEDLEEVDTEDEEVEAEPEQEAEQEEGLDVTNKEVKAWLRQINLWEFSRIAWQTWRENPNAKVQYAHIYTNKGYLTEKVEVTPCMFSEVFCLPHSQSPKLKKISDAFMKAKFGPPEGTRGYYMVRNSLRIEPSTSLGIWQRYVF